MDTLLLVDPRNTQQYGDLVDELNGNNIWGIEESYLNHTVPMTPEWDYESQSWGAGVSGNMYLVPCTWYW